MPNSTIDEMQSAGVNARSHHLVRAQGTQYLPTDHQCTTLTCREPTAPPETPPMPQPRTLSMRMSTPVPMPISQPTVAITAAAPASARGCTATLEKPWLADPCSLLVKVATTRSASSRACYPTLLSRRFDLLSRFDFMRLVDCRQRARCSAHCEAGCAQL
eukprot:2244727-Pleurochrysis_carterae.AAC.5